MLSLSAIAASETPLSGEIRVQCLANDEAKTGDGKPYRKLTFSDGSATLTHSVWSDAHAYGYASGMQQGACYALNGTWSKSKFGLEARSWSGRDLADEEFTAVFAGPPELREKQEADWQALIAIVDSLADGPLKAITKKLLESHELPFRRAAAARGNHHARRGGLVEHVSFMAQSANVLCSVYGDLRRDLLIAGVVFHDVGKLVENQYEKEGFAMPYSFKAECYGHIALGILLAHNLWRDLIGEGSEHREDLDALCHLILSHHGVLEWGSPVEPKMPEAIILHFVDNIDAKLEMFRGAFTGAKRLADGVIEKVRPFGHNLLETPRENSAQPLRP